jgi:hypothetical protein
MKRLVIAAMVNVTLGVGSASAQGYPAPPPVYGSQAFGPQQYHTGTIFSELFGHRASRPNSIQATAKTTSSHEGG